MTWKVQLNSAITREVERRLAARHDQLRHEEELVRKKETG